MTIKPVDDMDYVHEVRQAIRANGGYCPCQLMRTEATKCICEDFIERVKPGDECLCGLYVKLS